MAFSSSSGYKGNNKRFNPRQEQESHRINNRITAREVRLISEAGEQLGIIAFRDAMQMAQDAGLDLVEVSAPGTIPPVCKILDYGKLKYKEQKRESQARKKQAENTVKELRLRYATDMGALEILLNRARKFLIEGDKVKFTMRFKGREIEHSDLGLEKFNMIIEKLADVSGVDERSPTYGRNLYIVLAPLKK